MKECDLKDMCRISMIGFAVMVVLFFVLLFTGCSSTKHVPVETIKEKIESRDKLQRDSIHVYDSIYIRDKGDTVFVNRWHTEYKDRLLRDTAYIHLTDSIQVPYPVERELSKWESIKIELGGWAFGGLIVIVLVIIGWIVYRIRKKKLFVIESVGYSGS